MTRIKHEAMVGTGGDMCNLPENIEYNHHIMAYRKDVTGEILSTIPSQPNLLITHKNSMYMSGYWDSSSSVLSWRLLNIGDGSDILTTTTTTTTSPEPTQYVIYGSFATPLYHPEMVMVNLSGDEVPITVEFEDVRFDDFDMPSYGAYVVTTTVNPVRYKLKVKGYDSILLTFANTVMGETTLPNLVNWTKDPSTGNYFITLNFTSSMLTTTTSTTTTTTTTAPTSYSYQIRVASTNASLSQLQVTVSNMQTMTRVVAGVNNNGSSWTFSWTEPIRVETGWSFRFSGIGSANRNEYTATVSNQSFIGGRCTIVGLMLTQISIVEPDLPTAPIKPLSLDDPEDTNSLDGAINDYLNE